MPKKILMACMGLDIGGAETHVLELSKELKTRGNDVLVVSAGGAYEEELIRYGIRCFHAPMNKRNISLMRQSYLALEKIILDEKPDIVHAHARIPAFICGQLKKKYGFKFVTSAHWVFKVNAVLKALTDWGDVTIAVSEDIRTYLKSNYGLSDEKIINTINGIDTKKFSAATDASKILEECGFDKSKPILSYVSRMDEDRSYVARLLIENAEELRRRVPGIQLIIAGGGNSFDELNALANQQNEKAADTFIKMLGARTDINEIVAAGDVFVGVSRAALEAMAAEKPVVVAGNEGYIGVFNDANTDICIKTNFCARECEPADFNKLCEDISELFTKTENERKKLGEFSRNFVIKNYSVGRMADDAEKAYAMLEQGHKKKVLVSGYYGFGNLGDDTILLVLKNEIKKIDTNINIVALSNNPNETKERLGIDAVNRFNPLEIRSAMHECDYFISGGGSLLQDNTSTRSLMYYTGLIRYAHSLGKPVMFFSNGIGPVRLEANKRRVREVSEMADIITLRDEDSCQELLSMGVENKNIFVTADCVYAMDYPEKEQGIKILSDIGCSSKEKVVGISIRNVSGINANLYEFAKFADMISERGYKPVFICMQNPQDNEISNKVISLMSSDAKILHTPYNPYAMMSAISCMSLVVSTRLHSIVFAAHEHTPVIGIVYDPKVDSSLDALGMPSAGSFDKFNCNEAIKVFEEVINKQDEYKNRLSNAECLSRTSSMQNLDLLKKFLS